MFLSAKGSNYFLADSNNKTSFFVRSLPMQLL